MSDMTPEMRELKEAVEDMSDVVLTTFGCVDTGARRVSRLLAAARAVPPKPRRHTFGGVVFEETGEYRRARPGEWYFLTYGLGRAPVLVPPENIDLAGEPGHILRPVAVEGAK